MSESPRDDATSADAGSPSPDHHHEGDASAAAPSTLDSPRDAKLRRARERRLGVLAAAAVRERRVQEQSETQQFVVALNREVRLIHERDRRAEAAKQRAVEVQKRKLARRDASLQALNDVEARLALARTGRDGKIQGGGPLTVSNGALRSPLATSDASGKAPPRPLLNLNEYASSRPVYVREPLPHSPRRPAAALLLPAIVPSPKRDDAAQETPADAQKRQYLAQAAQKVLALRSR